MTEYQKIGEQLAQKAPFALLFTVILFSILFAVDKAIWLNLAYALGAGVLSIVLLLRYWHGKGGHYFILGLLAPLIAVMFADIPDFLAMAWVVNGFFAGAAATLWGYHLLMHNTQR
ncbi:hypothetical protein [Pseudoalteromonas 'SMAR']|uniref:hypothetical protein n=1 Tax=Pseudoalteromonas 'SMAR' TaxID=3416908 RepID=UPI003AF24BE1